VSEPGTALGWFVMVLACVAFWVGVVSLVAWIAG
jgi:hypothetical protein